MSRHREETLQLACKACNKYARLQQLYHQATSNSNRNAKAKLLKLNEYFFELERDFPFPDFLDLGPLDDVLNSLNRLWDNYSENGLLSVYASLINWFASNLPDFHPVIYANRPRTDNEDNLRMIETMRSLRSNYRRRGKNLMDNSELDDEEFYILGDQIIHACLWLRLQLEANRFIVTYDEIIFFNRRSKSIISARSGGEFLKIARECLDEINKLVFLRFA